MQSTSLMRAFPNALIEKRDINFALYHCDQIQISFRHADDRASPPRIQVQGKEMDDMAAAEAYVDYLLLNIRCVRILSLNVEINNPKPVNRFIEKFLDAANVRLEVLNVRRRYVGQRFELIPDLIQANADSLRVIGKLGVSEASEGLNERCRLSRLSLMNFDLIDDGEMEGPFLGDYTRQHLRRIGGTGAKFEHLSYTTYSGFELGASHVLFMLKRCGVESIRLTMQKGHVLGDPLRCQPMGPLLEALRRLELVGNCVAPSARLSVIFPNLSYYDFKRQDLTQTSTAVC